MLALLVLLVVFALDFVFVLLVLHAVVMLTNIYLQNLASIQKRTSPVKFAHLAEKSGKGSISNLSTKVLRDPDGSHHYRPGREGGGSTKLPNSYSKGALQVFRRRQVHP